MNIPIVFRMAALAAFAALPCAADKTVASPNELNAAVAGASAGEVITLKNGAYGSAAIRLAGKGTQVSPITVKAETPGQVVLTGASTLDFVGEWITLDGFKLEGVKATRTLVVFQDGAKGCRLTNSAILNSNSGENHWIHLKTGTLHRIDHCRFAGMNQPGMGIQFEVSATVPGDHRVDNCAFVDRAAGSGNGFETVRIGYSHQQDNLARVTFERNLFLRQNGENEIISNKSTGNVILRNTFSDNAGEFTCRHGDKARIEGNFFLRQDRGIRLIGSDHVVVNNYIADMKTDGLVLYGGESNPEPTGYEAATNPIIAFNTIVNCPAGVVVGNGNPVAPKNVRIANNAFLLPNGNAVRIDKAPSGIAYEGNLWQGRGAGVNIAGLNQADLKLVKGVDGVWRPDAGSAVKDAGAGNWADVLFDFDGASRAGAKDVGAFEVGADVEKRKPLTEKDVGPWWLGNTSTPDVGGPIAIRFMPRGRTWGEVMEPNALVEARDLLGRREVTDKSRSSHPWAHRPIIRQ